MFTKTEKALLDRAARRAADQAAALQKSLAGLSWGATKATKRAKLEFDRLMRDCRDLRALGAAMLKAYGVDGQSGASAGEVLKDLSNIGGTGS
jgi:hypothetical protein